MHLVGAKNEAVPRDHAEDQGEEMIPVAWMFDDADVDCRMFRSSPLIGYVPLYIQEDVMLLQARIASLRSVLEAVAEDGCQCPDEVCLLVEKALDQDKTYQHESISEVEANAQAVGRWLMEMAGDKEDPI